MTWCDFDITLCLAIVILTFQILSGLLEAVRDRKVIYGRDIGRTMNVCNVMACQNVLYFHI